MAFSLSAFIKKGDKSVIGKMEIAPLILDNRWHSLFIEIEMPKSIKKLEERIKSLMKQQAKLTNEKSRLNIEKKKIARQIMEISRELRQQKSERLENQIIMRQERLIYANDRLPECEKEIERIQELIDETNLTLFMETAGIMDKKVKKARKKLLKLDVQIENQRNKLDVMLEERKILREESKQACKYFVNLVGEEQLEAMGLDFPDGEKI